MRRTVWIVALVWAGCGLLSDVAQVSLRFPKKNFRLDTGDWTLLGGSKAPAVSCDLGCPESRALFCGQPRCSTDCDGATGMCQVRVTTSLQTDFDLSKEAPEFQKIDDQSVISVTIDRVYFDITENSLTAATPPLYLYMGPQTIMAPGDAGAELVGILDPLPPGQTGRVDVRFEGNGRQVMKRFLDNFHTPFRVLITGTLTVHADEDLPMGVLVGSVQADAHAGI